MNVQIRKTKAEEAFGEHFEAVAKTLPGDRWVRQLRADAMGAFATLGLPHRRIEAWKYTDLRERIKEAFPPAIADRTAVTPPEIDTALGPLAQLPGPRVVFVNGAYRADLSQLAGLEALAGRSGRQYDDAAAVFRPLGAVLHGGRKRDARAGLVEANLRPTNTAAQGLTEAPMALIAAFMTDGAVICIGKDTRPPYPLHLVFVSAGAQARSVAVRNALNI